MTIYAVTDPRTGEQISSYPTQTDAQVEATLLGIMPWNYPYYQVARFAAPNLAAGNAVLVKHAQQCPESAAAIATIFGEAGFPHGAYVNVYASTDQIEHVIADPRVQGVSLTGSE